MKNASKLIFLLAYVLSFCILCVSAGAEDILETQAGINFLDEDPIRSDNILTPTETIQRDGDGTNVIDKDRYPTKAITVNTLDILNPNTPMTDLGPLPKTGGKWLYLLIMISGLSCMAAAIIPKGRGWGYNRKALYSEAK